MNQIAPLNPASQNLYGHHICPGEAPHRRCRETGHAAGRPASQSNTCTRAPAHQRTSAPRYWSAFTRCLVTFKLVFLPDRCCSAYLRSERQHGHRRARPFLSTHPSQCSGFCESVHYCTCCALGFRTKIAHEIKLKFNVIKIEVA